MDMMDGVRHALYFQDRQYPTHLAEVLETFGINPEYPEFGREFYLSTRKLPDGSWEGVYISQLLDIPQFPAGKREAIYAKYSPVGANRRQQGYSFTIGLAEAEIGEDGNIANVVLDKKERVRYTNIVEGSREENEGYTTRLGIKRGDRHNGWTGVPWSIVEFGFINDLWKAGVLTQETHDALVPQKSYKQKETPKIIIP